MPLKLLFVGAATHDAVGVVSHYPGQDQRMLAETILYAGGGPSATSAVTASRLGLEVSFIGPVGDDAEGRLVTDGLAHEGVDVSMVQVDPDRQTQASLIICSLDTASRAIVTRDVKPFTLNEAAVTAVKNADWVHADHLGWPAVAKALQDVPPAQRPYLSIDPGNDLVGPDAELCDPSTVQLYAPPMIRLEAAFGRGKPSELLSACPADTVVATMGGGGSVGRSAEGAFVEVPGYALPDLRSTLGAGDVFHGALVTAISRGDELADALTYANAVAALSCRGIDGRSAIPTHDETLLFIKDNK